MPRSRAASGTIGAWWIGWAVLAIALLSPLDAWGAQLFSIHMVQHEVLMLVAAPLLVLGKPFAVLAWALPMPWRHGARRAFGSAWCRSVFGVLTVPVVAWWLHAIVVWVWHAPPLFEASLRNAALHDLQHATFLASALLFWWVMLHRSRGANPPSILWISTTLLHTGVLGMLLTFAPAPWYPFYAATTGAWGLTPLEDQQLGGLIMWVPSGALLLAIALGVAWRVLDPRTHPERPLARSER
jgi:putative membrane protein